MVLPPIVDFSSGGRDGCNAVILPCKRKSKRNQESERTKKQQTMTKSHKRKLQKLEEEKEKKVSLSKSIEVLEKYKLQEVAYPLLQSSHDIGQVESRNKKRRKALVFSKAGFEVSHTNQKLEEEDDDGSSSSSMSDQVQVCSRRLFMNGGSSAGSPAKNVIDNNHESSMQETETSIMNDDCERIESMDKVKGDLKGTSSRTGELSDYAAPRSLVAPTIVHVSRPLKVEESRKNLPTVMMEQEIMEAVNDHSTVIICGETGCGKTTQIPQFLFEAGYGSSQYCLRSGIIGVTQPRRVAAIKTAERVADELGLEIGKEVGYQVRFDKSVGESCSIKFMTDGILLRELQNDDHLKRYSVIVLDEAHEQSLNTDILIGILLRLIKTRQEDYDKQRMAALSGETIDPKQQVFPLKLVLMSATLRVEDFISDKRLFRDVPPVIEIPTRQFPVTTYFSKRTGTDYISQAYKKVLAIHKKLPRGGILVFVTGQQEVMDLCRLLDRDSTELVLRKSIGKAGCDASKTTVQQLDMKEINEPFDVDDNPTDGFSSVDEDQDGIYEDDYDSETESELEFVDDDGDSVLLNTPEINGNGTDNESMSIAALKAAFEALTGKTEPKFNSDGKHPISDTVDDISHKSHSSMRKNGVVENDNSPGGLRVVPFYAKLPKTAHSRVFEEAKEGERLVVVATNVAETSLTIPGVKYIVDTGRVKVKNYNSSNGMQTYNVQWISKASADQRKGRAGRTGPGHCYRLYSSAVYNNEFPDFSPPEILKVPIDYVVDVVLRVKSMNIEVSNFPFPTPPEAAMLDEAESCLKALEALDGNGIITPLGKNMTWYPINPRHSKFLLTVIRILEEESYYRSKLVLAYAVAAAAALSSSNPFVWQFEKDSKNHEQDQDGSSGTPMNNKVFEKQEKLKMKESAKLFREKISNPMSDALSVVYALHCYELSKSREEFCNENALLKKTMDEMSELRTQLLQLFFNKKSNSGSKDRVFGSLDEVELAWRDSHEKNYPLSSYEEGLLRQSICAGCADRVAKRASGFRYQACKVNETVFINSRSSVYNSAPEFLVYNELIQAGGRRPYMHGLTSVKPEWLVKYAPSLCIFSAPSTDTKPYYEPLTDQVLHSAIPVFGPHLWKLPPYYMPLTDDQKRYAAFAYALLEGQVFPLLKDERKSLKAHPASILRPEARVNRWAVNLLAKLDKKGIDTLAKLKKVWEEEDSMALKSELRDWFDESFQQKFEGLWSIKFGISEVMKQQERLPKKLKRKVRREKLKSCYPDM